MSTSTGPSHRHDPSDDDRKLIDAARQARERAYAPYSQFQVGAALRDDAGAIFAGVNVENASLGLSVCAERNAIFAMVAQGGRGPSSIAIVTADATPTAPCGACRQVLVEFAPELEILLANLDGDVLRFSIEELLAYPFLDYRAPGGSNS